MSQPKKTVATILAALFPKSHKTISEKLETEDFNAFASEAEEVSKRLTAQQEGNQAEQTDRKATEQKAVSLEQQLETEKTARQMADAKVAELEGKLNTAEADRDRYKAWFDKQAESGKGLPEADAANADDSLADYNSYALDIWKKSHQ